MTLGLGSNCGAVVTEMSQEL